LAAQLAYARQVVFVPGYGMATTQRNMPFGASTALEGAGVTVKFGIHLLPAACRVMNVLLAE
jgi:NAD/NADP transhydrogenase beta subunit